MNKKKFNVLDHVEEFVCAILMAVLAVVVFVQVVCRFLGSSLPWSEEFARYTAIWITFIGASLGIKEGAHVGVEALKSILPKTPKKLIELLCVLIMLFFCVVVLVLSIKIISVQQMSGQKSPAMRIPMWWAYTGMPIGAGCGVLRCIQLFFNIATGKVESVEAPAAEIPVNTEEEAEK